MNETDRQFLLLQINDALFPIGAYVHSYGLETYIQRGLICDDKSVKEWLMQYMSSSFIYSDMLAVRLAYERALAHDLEGVFLLEKLFLAARAPSELRQAAVKLGSRFIKTIHALPLSSINEVFEQYAAGSCRHIHPAAYGVFCAAAGIVLSDCLFHYMYAQAAGLVNTCVKSVPLSQTAGQQLLRSCSLHWPRLLGMLQLLSIDDFCLSTPGFDIRSMQHEALYSRLYMS
ncbi:urease accessory protein UreF [Pectinatus haikarae]|uniref:Urease accessory protein UreF n=1 Tax=Pectinatus haikarae TaxID=349096 RepID=A0ABT9Y4F9_9FIRM|nr:urease accessory protein UreF [Pectinatus haikarae]MDQ0202720.1 urease accessory protein [Pectinatus haikarae]